MKHKKAGDKNKPNPAWVDAPIVIQQKPFPDLEKMKSSLFFEISKNGEWKAVKLFSQ